MAQSQVRRKDLIKKSTMTASATLRNVRISPQKFRLIANLIKGRQVAVAFEILQFSPKKGSRLAEKLLRSAVSNAIEKGARPDALWVSVAQVNMGRALKRYIPQAKGQAHPIKKRSSHMIVEVAEVR